MTPVTATTVPAGSALHATLPQASFHDAYAAPLHQPTLSATEIFLRATANTPSWVARLMTIRNAIVRKLGLKDVGGLRPATSRPATTYKPGDRLGIFTIFAQSDTELLLGIDDTHLNVRVSLMKSPQPAQYVVSTVVHVHNWLGHVYMLPVGRIHPFVVRAMMRRTSV